MRHTATSPQSEEMAQARAALLALNDDPDETGALAAEALFELNSVHPPYPPARSLADGAAPTVATVKELLEAAARAAGDAQEVDRIIRAATCLTTPYPR